MTVLTPSETYLKIVDVAIHKSRLRSDQLFLQGLLSGYWIAIYGHAILTYGGSFFVNGDPKSIALSNLVFAALFPGAFMALIYTGAELYTGNTVTMMLLLCEKGFRELKSLVKVWGLSLLGNFIGATLCAYFFSTLAGDFRDNSLPQQYLYFIAEKKLSRNFGRTFISAIGCNSLVCLATWCSCCSLDGAGKILAMFYCVAVFVFGGYEHIIANMYLLSTAVFCNGDFSYGQVVLKNWIPVYLGNTVAGCVFTGLLWWYALHPRYTDLAPYTKDELVDELMRRFSGSQKHDNSQGESTRGEESKRWKQVKQKPSGRSLTRPNHEEPAAEALVDKNQLP